MNSRLPITFKASLDAITIVMTSIVIILLIFIGNFMIRVLVNNHDTTTIFSIIGGLMILMMTILLTWLYAPLSYTVNDHYLLINRRINTIRLKLDEIAEIRSIKSGELKLVIRTFGVGGLFGHYGKYYSSTLGNMTFYATKLSGRILIKTRQGDKIIITPDQKEIIEVVKYRMTNKF